MTSLNSISGDVTLAAGARISLTPVGKTVTIASTVPTGPTGPTGPNTYSGLRCPAPKHVAGFDGAGNLVCEGPATFAGVQVNAPISELAGWSQCYIDLYANSATSLATILAQ